MLTVLTPWLTAGNSLSQRDSICSNTISNVVALVMMLVFIGQIPINLLYWNEGGQIQCWLTLLAISVCPCIPILNQLQFSLSAKIALVLLFAGYLIITAFHLGREANAHYYFILGVFSVPFIFQGTSQTLVKIIVLCFCLLLIILSNTTPYFSDTSQAFVQFVANTNLISLAIAGLCCALFIQRNTSIDRQKIIFEQQRSDNLLLNILPPSIALRLKNSSRPVADYFDEATILFADIEGFSALSKSNSPITLVNLLNELYSEFDQILNQYQLEKIKTIGDEIMAVCGVPETNACHATQVCLCAIEMQKCFEKFCTKHNLNNGLRIGINTGPVVAGVIGRSKFSYDLWGDTVNLASRMESHGQSHKIQISESTYNKVKGQFRLLYRGNISIKGLGEVASYWLNCD